MKDKQFLKKSLVSREDKSICSASQLWKKLLKTAPPALDFLVLPILVMSRFTKQQFPFKSSSMKLDC